MCIAYADLIQVCELIQHVIKVGAYELLSKERKGDLASAKLSLDRVRGEIEKYVSSHTDFDDGHGKDIDVTKNKKGISNVGTKWRDNWADSLPSGK